MNEEDELAAEVLAHLRAKVREVGFSEIDFVIEEEMFSLGKLPSTKALKHYYEAFDTYLVVFDAESIATTENILSKHLDKRIPWGLYRGGDPERHEFNDDVLLDDLRRVEELGELRAALREVMQQLEIVPSYRNNNNNDNGMAPS